MKSGTKGIAIRASVTGGCTATADAEVCLCSVAFSGQQESGCELLPGAPDRLWCSQQELGASFGAFVASLVRHSGVADDANAGLAQPRRQARKPSHADRKIAVPDFCLLCFICARRDVSTAKFSRGNSCNATVYHQGELILLDLSFTSRGPNRYQVNMASYDRSGRMNYEKFLVEPADGTSDPLLVYFHSGSGFLGGGLTNFKFLSDTPYVIHLDLNEWVRFDKAGHYRLTVTSQRVSDASGGKSFYQGVVQEQESNSIQFRIIEADDAWQQSELKKILADFDSSPPPTAHLSSNQRLVAITKLRYLGSAEAARELARHLRGDDNQVDWACMFGLIGSPNRPAGYDEMKRLVVAPDFPVGGMFLNAIAMVPLDPAESAEQLRRQREVNWKDARSTLTAAISTKRGKALAVSVDTVLQDPDPNTSQEDRGKLVALLIEHFSELAIEEQRLWLEERWSTVKDSAWLPTLRTIAAEYGDYPVPNAPNVLPTYNYFKLSGDGLIRWYELDPEGARAAVLAEIVRPRPRYSANTLGMLPDKVLPNEERAIADHFLAAEGDAVEGNLASLLNRYADAAVLAEVLPKIVRKVGPWACIPENNAVAYVQRVDPEAAKPLMERSSGCRTFPSSSFLP